METIKTLIQTADRLKWEVAELEHNCDVAIKTIHNLKAENARYREALEFIAKGDIAPASIKESYIDQAYQRIAKEALEKTDADS